MNRRLTLVLVPVLLGTMVGASLAASGRNGTEAPDEIVRSPETRAVSLPSDPVEPPPVEPEVSPAPAPASAPAPSAPAYDVVAVQRRLTDLRYYVGAIDGAPGPALRSAVMAFQKVHGLGADGVVGPKTLAALNAPVTPPLQGSAPRRIEIDLTKQVLYFVQGGQLQRIVPVSSGNGATYKLKNGGTAKALTPTGNYTVGRKIRGLREADLGSLYDPMYFYQGWAIHGSNSVPAYPASHGCVRVTRADALWLFARVPVGTPVLLYGGTHTFTAGSDAAGTTNPAGDTAAEPTPAPSSPQPTASSPAPAPSSPRPVPPSPQPSPQPSPSPSSPQPAPSSPPPSASPSPSTPVEPTAAPSPTVVPTP